MVVYLGFIYEDAREIAVKRVLKILYKGIETEVQLLVQLNNQNLHHPNILDYMVMAWHAYYIFFFIM